MYTYEIKIYVQKKVYDEEFKIQAVKLGREIGFSKAAKELVRRGNKVNADHFFVRKGEILGISGL